MIRPLASNLPATQSLAPRPLAPRARAFAPIAFLCVFAAAAPAPAAVDAPADPVRDHAAILAMRGEYLVDFDFAETVALAPGYERRPAMHSGGNEVVIVVEDTPTKIVLQHLLVSDDGSHVTKHWRQDWRYEAPSRFEFSADRAWIVRPLPPALTRGAWTQCVYEVSDAPRYCGTGRWEHRGGVSTWTSDRGWRPLPRREYTKRSDYDAIEAVNRHTIVPGGWTHEQDNAKVLRAAPDGVPRWLVRETGFNDYRKAEGFDFGPAYRYWDKTRDYWAQVRARWDAALAGGGLRLRTGIDGMAMIVPLFEQASTLESGGRVEDRDIDAVFLKWVEPAASPMPGPRNR